MNIRMGARGVAVAGAAAVIALALVGCVPAAPSGTSGNAPSSTPVPTGTTSPSGPPTYNAKGDAAANLAYFTLVGAQKIGPHPNITGKTIVKDLVAAGFDKQAMEITPDKTSIGLVAWNVEFSVKLQKTCLIGQAGNVGFNAFAAPLLASGKCLVGTTRKIDW
jgi:hypothetical protein